LCCPPEKWRNFHARCKFETTLILGKNTSWEHLDKQCYLVRGKFEIIGALSLLGLLVEEKLRSSSQLLCVLPLLELFRVVIVATSPQPSSIAIASRAELNPSIGLLLIYKKQ